MRPSSRRVASEERDKVKAAMADYPLQRARPSWWPDTKGTSSCSCGLLIEAGAIVPYLSTAVNTNPLARVKKKRGSASTAARCSTARTSTMRSARCRIIPTIASSGRRRSCSHAKELGIPSIYYTNAMATRSLMLAEGASDMLSLMTSTYRSKARYRQDRTFFARRDDAGADLLVVGAEDRSHRTPDRERRVRAGGARVAWACSKSCRATSSTRRSANA